MAKRGFENSEEGYMVEKGCSLTLRPDELARPCAMYQKIIALMMIAMTVRMRSTYKRISHSSNPFGGANVHRRAACE